MPVPRPAPPPVTEQVIGMVAVKASALNVRTEPSTDAEILQQAKRGEALSVLVDDDGWLKVRLKNGVTGWVSGAHVTRAEDVGNSRPTTKRKSGCPDDSDFAFTKTPTLAFSEIRKPGLIVVDAYVNTKGVVTSTKVISNTTGDESLAFLAEREIKSAEFTPPIRNCVPRAFIYSYKRTF